MLSSNLPVVQVVLPLIAAPICTLLANARLAWAFTTLIAYAALLISFTLLGMVLGNGVLIYELGGWAAPWGIEYRIDALNAIVIVVLTSINAVALPFARASVESEIRSEQIHLFYTAWLLCFTGLLGITITADAFNLFVFLEISSLSTYLLVSLGRNRRALLGAFQYLVIGTIGATFILIAVGLLYMMTGTLNMNDLAQRLPAVSGTRTIKVAFAFFVIGIGIKMALFPMHKWLPNVYTYAPSVISVFLAATATKAAVYVLLRIVFSVFGHEFSFGVMRLDAILLPLALLAIFSGSIVAVYQKNVKRLLAYSSVAQIGYMVLGIGIATVLGVTGAITHLFNHALIKGALFMAVGCVVYRTGGATLEHMRGIGTTMPYTMAAFVIAGFSLIGVPLTAGFISKWYLISAALADGSWWIAVLIVVSSLIAVIYIWRVVEAAYFQVPMEHYQNIKEAPLSLIGPTWVLVLANIYFGIFTTIPVGFASRAANLLLPETVQ